MRTLVFFSCIDSGVFLHRFFLHKQKVLLHTFLQKVMRSCMMMRRDKLTKCTKCLCSLIRQGGCALYPPVIGRESGQLNAVVRRWPPSRRRRPWRHVVVTRVFQVCVLAVDFVGGAAVLPYVFVPAVLVGEAAQEAAAAHRPSDVVNTVGALAIAAGCC